ncbi:nuclear transport factor 2 family protein [Rhizorhabdus dicambivorans]|uniref:Nuclear transport factor 2 family protein n=1 Tax=Rhizorhabdus dicambivorans TaxID=1850238 RepID=A0A2A4G315_9SPHN|nr:nuclear transport factor 2 family protein [Rhizorhabdus dicambivorans]ATE65135.1 nuclear transport factor 2 family protein [Rhizorhabdus dicambivorans]PCE44408.1 nuclear transport factor 2 family protein [Rhizorhabdus dicambivorans]
MNNVETTLAFVAAYNDADVERMNSLMTEDGEVLMPAIGVNKVRWQPSGPASEMARDRTIEVRRIFTGDDVVAFEFLWHAISKGGPGLAPVGERVTMENCIVLSFRDGLIRRYCEYIGRHTGMDLLTIASRLAGATSA